MIGSSDLKLVNDFLFIVQNSEDFNLEGLKTHCKQERKFLLKLIELPFFLSLIRTVELGPALFPNWVEEFHVIVLQFRIPKEFYIRNP